MARCFVRLRDWARITSCIACWEKYARAERQEVMEIKTSRSMVFIFVKKPLAEFGQ